MRQAGREAAGPASAPTATPVRVRVPATAANLGPGYDSFGLALALYDEVTARRSEDGGLHISISGVGAGTVPTDASHLVVRAAAEAFGEMGEPLPGLTLDCVNTIPHGSGQGSSASAIVAGILLARELARDGRRRLDDAAVLALGTRMEGHPDNIAPALMGGFTVAWTGPAGPRAVRRDVHPDVKVVAFTADHACATEAARAILPPVVPHADAAAGAARAALLVHALTCEPALLWDATEDLLHQSYRAPAMPVSAALLERLRSSGVPAVLSGAGPSLLALGADLPDLDRLRELAGTAFQVREMPVAATGAEVTRR
ncbi:MAG TPA: homoserine kinase [Nakamurella sp.]|nr:homoserine kinase [Nakamurella sp.]